MVLAFMKTITSTLLAASLALGLVSCKKDSPAADGKAGASTETAARTLRFSAIPDENATELTEKFNKVAAYLSKELGVPVEYQHSVDYAASVEAFKNGDIHLAWFGGLTGVQAREAVDGARAIAQGIEDPDYVSYFIANASTGLEKSDDFPAAIADKKFTFGSKSSTSGRLMPSFFIERFSGKKPEDFFTQEAAFSGSHDNTIEFVASGRAEVGALSYKTFDKRVKEGKVDPAKVKIIWTTPTYADYNWTAHPDLETAFGEGFTDKLQKVLISVKDPVLLDAFNRTEIISAKNEDFDGVKQIATDLDMLR